MAAPLLVVRVAANLSELRKNLIEGVAQIETSSWAMASAFVGASAAAVASIRSAAAGLRELVSESASGEAATSRLTAALTAQGTATPAVIAQYAALVREFQNTTTNSSSLVTAMQALLVQIGHVMPGQMQGALLAAANLSAGLGIDLKQATELVAKAIGTGGESLGRLKAVLGDTKIEGQGAEAIFAAINSRFSGQAQAQLQTYAGQMQQLGNKYDDVKQSAGDLLTGVLVPMLQMFNQLPEGVQTTLMALGLVAGVVTPIAIAVGSVSAAITALLPVLTVAWPAAWAAVTGALRAFAPYLGPVGIIAAGIVSWFVVFKNLDVFVWAALKSFDALKSAFSSLATSLVTFAQRAYEGVKTWLVDRFNAIVDNITSRIGWIAGVLSAAGSMPLAQGGVIQGRAGGGDVSAGRPYMVGERGPELFVPRGSGTIVPNHALSGNITIAPVININGGTSSSATDIRDAVSGAILDIFRSGAIPMPSPV